MAYDDDHIKTTISDLKSKGEFETGTVDNKFKHLQDVIAKQFDDGLKDVIKDIDSFVKVRGELMAKHDETKKLMDTNKSDYIDEIENASPTKDVTRNSQ